MLPVACMHYSSIGSSCIVMESIRVHRCIGCSTKFLDTYVRAIHRDNYIHTGRHALYDTVALTTCERYRNRYHSNRPPATVGCTPRRVHKLQVFGCGTSSRDPALVAN